MQLGMTTRWDGFEGWGLCPRPAWFCLIHPRSALHDRENFLAPSLLLGALRSPASPHKTLLFVNLSHKYYNFLIKHVSLIKIYLKLQLNLSYQIKLIFNKNCIILSKCIFNKINHNKNKNFKV